MQKQPYDPFSSTEYGFSFSKTLKTSNLLQSYAMYMPFPDTGIYALTDSRQSLGRSTLDVVAQMLAAGITLLQYREKEKNAGAMLEESLAIRAMTRKAGCCFIVNDHVDIALLCEADGVHVGQDDLPLAAVRQLVGKERIVGVSIGNIREAETAVAGGADYLGIGALFATSTKAEAVPVGFALLEEITSRCPIPVVAIGGVNEYTLAEVLRHGARCCAIVSDITMAEDIPAKILRLRSIFATGKNLREQGNALQKAPPKNKPKTPVGTNEKQQLFQR